jgi:hypothetical protein
MLHRRFGSAVGVVCQQQELGAQDLLVRAGPVGDPVPKRVYQPDSPIMNLEICMQPARLVCISGTFAYGKRQRSPSWQIRHSEFTKKYASLRPANLRHPTSWRIAKVYTPDGDRSFGITRAEHAEIPVDAHGD